MLPTKRGADFTSPPTSIRRIDLRVWERSTCHRDIDRQGVCGVRQRPLCVEGALG